MFGHSRFASEIRALISFCHRMTQCDEFRAANRDRIVIFDFGKKTVAAPSYGFHKARTLSEVAEGLADFADRFVEPVVEIHESVRGPKFFLKFFASYDLAGVFKQHRQDLEGLILKANPKAVLAQFAGAKIQLENPKVEPPAKLIVFPHV